MRKTCRISGMKLTEVISLGDLYVSYFYKEVLKDAPHAPLNLGIGEGSSLLQLVETTNQDFMYRQYWYKSGTNMTMTRQLKDIVDFIPRWARLRDGDVVLDIGCNDGTLLAQYPENLQVVKVGIDPAENLAPLARQQCDLHANAYFGHDTFLGLTGGRKAKVITAIAMFYGLDDPNKFMADIARSLTDDGILILQLSYTPLMIEQNAFDNICHEHIEYYTLQSLDHLARRHDLKIVDVELNDVNSGSFRVVLTRKVNVNPEATLFYQSIGDYRFKSMMAYEKAMKFDEPGVYVAFMKRIVRLKDEMNELLDKLKRQGKVVYGYGASTKGNTLLQYYGIGPDKVRAIAERQPQKYGLFTAGSWIPIVSEAEMRQARPDYLLILPWHFTQEFILREGEFMKGGGKFIIPLPEVHII